jgi:two-component system, sporulation sensor kinase A
VLDQLLVRLLTSAIENFGAQRGCLIIDNDRQLEIVAVIERSSISIVPAISIDSETARGLVSIEVIHSVVHTQEYVFIQQATQDSLSNQDAGVQACQAKSILCAPLIYEGNRAGILYLENFEAATFTIQRLEILQALFTQAAISLDNTQLHQPLELGAGERTNELMQANDRLQTEILERQKFEQILKSIVEGTVSVTGVDFFRSLVRSLAQSMGVRYAFVSKCIDSPPTRVSILAFWQGSELGEEFEYDLQGSPCEEVINHKSYQLFPAQLQSWFPEDQDIIDIAAQSYAGIPLLNSMGELIGHLAVLDNQPMEAKDRDRAILEIFAARAAAEMERLQIEADLRVSETKFATAFRFFPEAITIISLRDGRCLEANPRALQILGYTREEMIGFSNNELQIFVNPADRVEVARQIQEQGKVSTQEVWFRRKSGEIFPAFYSAETICLDGELFLLAVASDITLLKQAEKALARLAEIGELAAMIVHEVRNPLTTILMGLTSFKKLQLPERFQEYLTLSLDEADRMQRLLSQILLYSKPQILDLKSIDLGIFIFNMLDTLKATPAAVGKHLNLIPATSAITVSADLDKLKQVMINLVANAYEAVNPGEIITIEIQRIEDLTEQNCHTPVACIQIHNGGTPIPANILPQLSKPFFTTKVSGTGLGLAIVKRIIEAHHGKFILESSAEAGTIAKVQIPLN